MKLLYDQNLPSQFVSSLAELFAGSQDLKSLGFAAADDQAVWNFARENNFAIISKDSDFHQMSFLFGAPPKVIWLRCGNCSTTKLEAIIRRRATEISTFIQSNESALLVIRD